METRMIEQVKIWKLMLNPMRENTENLNLVAWADDKQKLLDWYNSHKVDRYFNEGSPSFVDHGSSHNWCKSFEKGSPLEWYNPMDNEDGRPNHHGQGIHFEWVDIEILPNINIGIRI